MTDPLVTALFLVAAFMSAGLLHSAWLASPLSRPLAVPIDGGVRVRGRRLFGDNKTYRGIVAVALGAAVGYAAFPPPALGLSRLGAAILGFAMGGAAMVSAVILVSHFR